MSRAAIVYKYADGDSIQVTLESTHEHPDALDMLATRIVRMYHEVQGVDDTTELEP